MRGTLLALPRGGQVLPGQCEHQRDTSAPDVHLGEATLTSRSAPPEAKPRVFPSQASAIRTVLERVRRNPAATAEWDFAVCSAGTVVNLTRSEVRSQP